MPAIAPMRFAKASHTKVRVREPHAATWRPASHVVSARSLFPARQTSNILIAEDDDEMRALLSEAFCDAGYQVTEVADGRQLADCLAGPPGRVCPKPDIVVSDLRMPGHSGLEVLAALRNTDWAMPVILITAFGDEETHEEAQRLGAVAVMDKPVDVERVVDAVQSVVPAEI